MSDNPLASRRARAPQAKPDPMLAHAKEWQHAHAQPDDVLTKTVQALDNGLPIMGALASDPNVTAKDVIKAVSAATAEQHMSPSAGVAFISQIPPDPDKLQPWLKERYAANLAAAVHAKAALMSRQQPAQGAPAGQPAAAQPVMAPTAPTPAAAPPGGPTP